MNPLDSIIKAKTRIEEYAITTPLIPLERLKHELGFPPFLKLENLQSMGAFKIRGAANAVLSLTEDQRKRGVVTASSGNHGRALAVMANALGIPCWIFLPETVTSKKLEAIQALGVNIKLVNPIQRIPIAQKFAAEHEMQFVHPFDQQEIIYGQGTIGLEILEQKPDVKQVFVPVGGGGLISGIALALKLVRPDITIVGLEPANVPKVTSALNNRRCEVSPTVADALMTPTPGVLTLDIIRRYVDDIISVKDEFILDAFSMLTDARMLVEPSSAIGIGACLQERRLGPSMEDTIFVISGGNISLEDTSKLLKK